MNTIEISNLGHRFDNGTWALQNINLTIAAGEFMLIGGPNGAGKTTLLRHLNGLLLPDVGTVKLDGIDISKILVKARQAIGMVFQDADSQIVGETVFDDTAFGPENLCLDRAEINRRVAAALQVVGLHDFSGQRPHLLSGGEKRRLAIAGVLAMQPEVLLFDEPFSNLDFPGVKNILKQILALHQSGHTIVIAAHNLEMVIEHADRLIIMQAGKIVREGLPAELVGDLEPFGIRVPDSYRRFRETRS